MTIYDRMNFKHIYTILCLLIVGGATAQEVNYHRVFADNEVGDTVMTHLASDVNGAGDFISLLTRKVVDENKSLIYLTQDKKGKLDRRVEIDFGLDSVRVLNEVDLVLNSDSMVYAAVLEVDGVRTPVIGKLSGDGANVTRPIVGVNLDDTTFGNGSGYSNVENFFDSSYVYSISDTTVLLSRVTPQNQTLWSKRIFLNNEDGDRQTVTANDLDVAEDSLIYSGGTLSDTDLYQLVVDSNGIELMAKAYQLAVGDYTLGAAAITSVTEERSVMAGTYAVNGTSAGYIIFADTIGEVVWAKTVTLEGAPTEIYDVTHALSGDIVVVGKYFPQMDSTRLFSAALDLDGNIRWISGYGDIPVREDIAFVSLGQSPSGATVIAANGFVEAGETGIVYIDQSVDGTTPCSDTIMQMTFPDLAVQADTLLATSTFGLTIILDTVPAEVDRYGGIIEPTLRINAMNTRFCPNEPINELLTAVLNNVDTSRVTYAWMEGEITTDTLRAMAEGDYTVTVTVSENTCYTMCDTIKLERSGLPEVEIIPDFSQFCADGTISLFAAVSSGRPQFEYLWGGGEASASIIVTTEGTYNVKVFDQCGDSAETTIDLVIPENVITADINTETFCSGGQVLRSYEVFASSSLGGSDFTVLWSTDEISNQIVVDQNGTYSVTVTDACGDILVLERTANLPTDEFDAAIAVDRSCQDGEILLTVNGFSTVQGEDFSVSWSTNETGRTISVIESGTYMATITNECGSQVERSVEIDIEAFEVEVIEVRRECRNGVFEVIIEATTSSSNADNLAYEWNTEEFSNQITVGVGTYSVTVVDPCGDMAVGTIEIEPTENTASVEIEEIRRICDEDGVPSVTLNAIGVSDFKIELFVWNTMDSLSEVTVPPGVYTVTFTDAACGFASASITVVEVDLQYPAVFFPKMNQVVDDMNMGVAVDDVLDATFGPVVCGSLDAVEEYDFKIFNRWGNEVFSTTDPNERWDGTWNGEDVPAEVYVWYAAYQIRDEDDNLSERIVQKGDCTILYYRQ